METGVLLDHEERPLFWHLPAGRSATDLPDSQRLWTEMFEQRRLLSGFAHSHPGHGIPRPSQEDLTTFSAIERALDQSLTWWITSADLLLRIRRLGPRPQEFYSEVCPGHAPWVAQLRRLSKETTCATTGHRM